MQSYSSESAALSWLWCTFSSTEQSHMIRGISLTEAAHTLRNIMIRVTKKSEEKSGISFILKKPENILNHFTVFLFLHSVKTSLDGPNSVLSSAQTNQKEFNEDYQSSIKRYGSRMEQLLPGITSPCDARYSRGKRVSAKLVSIIPLYYFFLFASYLSSHNLPLQWAYGIVII